MKLITFWDIIDLLSSYLLLNYDTFNNHLFILPTTFGLWRHLDIKQFVCMITWWLWKHGCRR